MEQWNGPDQTDFFFLLDLEKQDLRKLYYGITRLAPWIWIWIR
jgi:hypothetical protein